MGVCVGMVSPLTIQQVEPHLSMYNLHLSAVCPDSLVGVSVVCGAVTIGGDVEYIHAGNF